MSRGVHNLWFGLLFALLSFVIALETRGKLPYSDRINWFRRPSRTRLMRVLSGLFVAIGLGITVIGVIQICSAI